MFQRILKSKKGFSFHGNSISLKPFLQSDLDRDVDDSDTIESDGLEQEDELYREPGDGEHQRDDSDQPDHSPLVLVVGTLPADGDGSRGLRGRELV